MSNSRTDGLRRPLTVFKTLVSPVALALLAAAGLAAAGVAGPVRADEPAVLKSHASAGGYRLHPGTPIASPPVFYRHASTFSEGLLRGRADLVRAAGEFNYNTALARIRNEQARRLAMENDKRRAELFYEKRELNKQRRAEQLKPVSAETAQRIAQSGLPDRLAPQQLASDGRLNWPESLQSDRYAVERQGVESALQELGHTPNAVARRAAVASTNALIDKLRADVHTVSPMDYVASRKFLTSLRYELQVPASHVPATLAAR